MYRLADGAPSVKSGQFAEGYSPVTNGYTAISDSSNSKNRWKISNQAAGDLVITEGNSVASRYIALSLDPLSSGTETRLDYVIPGLKIPFRCLFGLSRSLPTVGCEFSTEIVTIQNNNAPPVPIEIAALSQTTTTLTVTTVTPHDLVPGVSISIAGAADSRFNYPSIVVATIPTPYIFTVTAGPAGNLPSVTATPVGALGFMYSRSRLGYARDGTSMIFENASATNASFYTRSETGDALSTGTATGNHSITIATTASAQPVNSIGSYSFQSTSVYSIIAEAESICWMDKPIDSATANFTIRTKREQVIPNPYETYGLRVRATRAQSVTKPNAEIVSATKTGTTTATIVTATPHGLTVADVVNIFGIRDATNFPNLTGASAVTSIIDDTRFTVVIGSASTTNSFGGYVSRMNGGVSQPGAVTQAIQSISRTGNYLTVTGSATWTSLSIGDLVNIYGVRDSAGADLGFNGAYRVYNFVTSALTLEPIENVSPIGIDIASTICGGGVIKRSDLRIHFVRFVSYDRMIVEAYGASRGSDLALSTGVTVTNTAAVTISGTPTISVSQVGGTATANTLIVNTRAQGVCFSASASNLDVASAARTAGTANSGTIVDEVGGACSALLNVTAVSAPTSLDVVLQESFDNGTTWIDAYHFERLTAVSTAWMPPIPIGGRIRWQWTVVGTSFTFTITKMRSPIPFPLFRQYFDRTAGLLNGTVNATSAAFNVAGSKVINARITAGAITTTGGTYVIQVADDGANWSNIASTSTVAVANSTVTIPLSTISARFARLLCTSAASNQTGVVASFSATN